ncbi:hypothetical protein CEP66_24445 [Citrobacter koseri]|nr:hypothetical protein AM352_03855 [Citrobacter koseri]AVE66551.1 hypothetical protein AM351_01305 [Citrobacter koseri]AVK73905.1 hypothetical protein CEP66_24445 [Citrobacter koseri]PNN13633.1 hypothetical protein AL526_013400 [Citrobacter koseri]PNO79416.1 hypothetical protein MC77_010910 [Citrobacter koseri]
MRQVNLTSIRGTILRLIVHTVRLFCGPRDYAHISYIYTKSFKLHQGGKGVDPREPCRLKDAMYKRKTSL